MPKYYPSIAEDIREWMLAQPVFFVASAPLNGKHINVSPKGHPSSTFAVLSPNQVAYLDATGSGCETISHIYEPGNGRVTVMFNSFDTAPRILRLFSTGRVVEQGSPQFKPTIKKMRESGMQVPGPTKEEEGLADGVISKDEGYEGWLGGIRAVILLDVWKVQTSCGFGVPLLGSAGKALDPDGNTHSLAEKGWNDRPTMPRWAVKKLASKDTYGMANYRKEWNGRSLDGLPGLELARRSAGERIWAGSARAWAMGRMQQWQSVLLGAILAAAVFVMLVQLGILPPTYKMNCSRLQ